uniref:KASH domain-containing protein n=1 Tax=Schistocephalus solidus TaxID=70667 RepID=A0A0V0JAX9_SCHSO
MEYLKETANILHELNSIKQEFNLKQNGVEIFAQSSLHDRLQKLGARKRALRACLFSKTITNPDCLTREMPRAVDLFGEVQAKYEQLEREWRTTIKLVSPLDPIKNYSAAVKAIKSDQERNYCWLRRILSNLPNRKHWMHFLCRLCDVEQKAALNYYQASLHEVEDSARNISAIYRLLFRLRSASSLSKEILGTDNQIALLWQSNVTCERLCYEVWLRLLELTVCLEGRQMPLARLEELPWSFLQTRGGEDVGSSSVTPKILRSLLQGPECLSLNDRLAKRLATGSRPSEKRRPKTLYEHGTNMSNQERNHAEHEDQSSAHERLPTQRHSYKMRTRPATAPSKFTSVTGHCVKNGELQCAEDFSISNSPIRTTAAVTDGSASTGGRPPEHIRVAAMPSSEGENSSNMDSLESASAACPWLRQVGSLMENNKNNFKDCPFGPGNEEGRYRGLWTRPNQIAAQSCPFYLPRRDIDLSTGASPRMKKVNEIEFLKSGFPQLWTERPENAQKSAFMDSIRQGSTGSKPWLLPHPRPNREPHFTDEGPLGTSVSVSKPSVPSPPPVVPKGRRSRSTSDMNSHNHRYKHHRLRSSFSSSSPSSSISLSASASQPCQYSLSDQEFTESRLLWQVVNTTAGGTFDAPGASSVVTESFRVRRVNSYLRAAERAETMVRGLLPLPHSYSNLDFYSTSANHKRRSISENRLPLHRPRRVTRSLSLEAIRSGRFQRRPRTSSNGRSLGTPSHALSEYLSTYWDDYQVPFYSSSEIIGSPEPPAPLPPHLNWEDCFGEETEALELGNCFARSGDFSGQILDDWSFDGLCNPSSSSSSASLSYSSPRRSRTANSNAASDTASSAPYSASPHGELVCDLASPVAAGKRADKCEQTELTSDLLPSLNSTTKQAAQSRPSLDLTTTHTSGYESGPDAGDCLHQRSSDRTRDTAVQTPNSMTGVRGRSLEDHLPFAIPEEPDSSSDGLVIHAQRSTRGSEILVRSEQNLEKLRSFLLCILSGTSASTVLENGTDETSPQTAPEKSTSSCSRATQASGCALSTALEKSFECISESTEQNLSMLSSLSEDRVKDGSQCHPLELDCGELATRWRLLLVWTRRHFEDLRELNRLQSRLSELAARSRVLSGFADRAFDVSNSLPSAAEMTQLCSESTSLLEATEVVHKGLLSKRLTGTAAVVPTTGGQQLLELQDLEAQFEAVYDSLLDSAIKHSSAVTDAVTAECTRIALLCSTQTYWTNFSPNKENEITQTNRYDAASLSSSADFSLIDSSKTDIDGPSVMTSSALMRTAIRPQTPSLTQKVLPIFLPLLFLVILYICFYRLDSRLFHLFPTQRCLGAPRWRIFTITRSSPPPQ